MVCQGTKSFVLLELKKLNLIYSSFKLGEIDFDKDLSLSEIRELDHSLRRYGLEVTFRNSKLVSEIRKAILDLVENDMTSGNKLSNYISQKVGNDYAYINKYFTNETGMPIEEYYIEMKFEKMKLNEPSWPDAFSQLGKSA
jgi:hypothetical protein